MKLFRYTSGHDDKFAPAVDEKDAYERRAEVDPTFHFLPVQIEELTVEGYEITLTPLPDNGAEAGKVVEYREDQSHIVAMNRDQLKKFLSDKEIEFTPQWGENKLRELALQHS